MERMLFVSGLGLLLVLARFRHQQSLRKVVHIKGFASFVDFSLPRNAKGLARGLEYLNTIKPAKVVWDGDQLKEDSFTYAIQLFAAHFTETKFILVVPKIDKATSIIQQWRNVLQDQLAVQESRVVDLAANEAEFIEHGLKTLDLTQAREVLVLGLGSCVAAEIKRCEKERSYVKFTVIDIERYHPCKQCFQSMKTFLGHNIPDNVTVLPIE
jgi:hypothetical protein